MNMLEMIGHQRSQVHALADEQFEVARADTPLRAKLCGRQRSGLDPAANGLLGDTAQGGYVLDGQESFGRVLWVSHRAVPRPSLGREGRKAAVPLRTVQRQPGARAGGRACGEPQSRVFRPGFCKSALEAVLDWIKDGIQYEPNWLISPSLVHETSS